MTAVLATLSLALASALASPAGDQSQSLSNGVELRAWSRWPSHVQGGWAPIFIELRNESDRTRAVTVKGRRSDWRSTWAAEVRVELAAGSAQAFELLAPMATDFSSDVGIEVSSDGAQSWVNGVVGTNALRHGARALVLLTEREFEPGELERWNSALAASPAAGAPSGTGIGAIIVRHTAPGPVEADIAVVRPGELPTHTAAYSSLDLVVLDAASAWPSEAKLAPLTAWMRSGGDVLVIGAHAERAARSQPLLASWMEPRFALATDVALGESYRAALGRLWIARDLADLEGPAAAWVDSILTSRSAATPRLSNWRGEGVLPDLALDTLPHRVFAALLLAFAILIGPVNFALVQKRKRPALLLITIPAISLAVTLLLLAYGILHQGLDVKTASWSSTVLDQRAHVSSSIEKRQLFAGLAPAAGLRPGAGSVLHAVPDDFSGAGLLGGENNFVTRHDQGWLLSGDFLPTRRAVAQMLSCDRAERARLEVNFAGGQAEVVNNLGASVEALLVRDASGRSFGLSGSLAVGARAVLAELNAIDASALVEELLDSAVAVTPPATAPAESVPQACYLARLASGVFRDDCGIETNELSGRHIVLGVLPLEPEER